MFTVRHGQAGPRRLWTPDVARRNLLCNMDAGLNFTVCVQDIHVSIASTLTAIAG